MKSSISNSPGQSLKASPLSAFYCYDTAHFPLNISKAELVALKNLSWNKRIVILRPDKGNGVVILDYVDYINKVESLFLDASKFKKLDTEILDLCLKHENKFIRFLRDTLLRKRLSQKMCIMASIKMVAPPVFRMASQRFTSRIVQLGPSYQP